MRNYAHRTRVLGGINFGDLVKNSPIHQIKIPAKISGYTVCMSSIGGAGLGESFGGVLREGAVVEE